MVSPKERFPEGVFPKEIEEVVQSEAKQGYLNSAVLGGFSGWLSEQAERLAKQGADARCETLRALATEYEQESLLGRPVVYQQIVAVLVELLADQPAQATVLNAKPLPQEFVDSAKALATSVQYLKGVGPKKAVLLRKLGIYTVGDLLYYFPRDYEERGAAQPIAELEIGESVTIRGRVLSAAIIPTGKRVSILKAVIADGSGSISATWFNQKYLLDKLEPGRELLLYGKAERRYSRTDFMVQDFEFVDADSVDAAKILPVYPTTANLSQKSIRSTVALAWEKYGSYICESLPTELLNERRLIGLREAVKNVHFPSSPTANTRARARLAYEELLVLQMAILANRVPDNAVGIARERDEAGLAEFLACLDFKLTGAQERVIAEVVADLEQSKPMTRLVQGDVGSGKTIVAAAALYLNARAGYQGALMVPTEILAKQHFQSLAPLFARLGCRTALFTGDATAKERRELQAGLAAGEIDVVIGTHTLFQKTVEFKNLALAVTDEQHRFGVMQRSVFQEKGRYADTLVMTATPIPRTLAMTLYGDLDVSVIDELPPGRQEIKTYAVDYGKEARALGFIEKELAKGRQAYIVCPLVDESDKLELESAVQLADRLQRQEFKSSVVGLLHGKMKAKEKDELMQAFAAGVIRVLVATTVIEVGINVPNATVMMIRDAERFGLAQLHQLRGRVGRGGEQSYCILLHNAKTPVARERMQTMCRTANGFEIAEADLRLRGAGEFWGTRQHGVAEFKIANPVRDVQLMAEARKDALELLRTKSYEGTLLAETVQAKLKLLNS